MSSENSELPPQSQSPERKPMEKKNANLKSRDDLEFS